jgi:Phospholipase_D-nuclease N-terminal
VVRADLFGVVRDRDPCQYREVPLSGFFAFFVVFWVASTAFWIWTFVDAIRVPEDRFYRDGSKLIWGLVVGLGGFIGAIVYLAIGRPDPATRATMRQGGFSGPVPPPPPFGSLPEPPAPV